MFVQIPPPPLWTLMLQDYAKIFDCWCWILKFQMNDQWWIEWSIEWLMWNKWSNDGSNEWSINLLLQYQSIDVTMTKCSKKVLWFARFDCWCWMLTPRQLNDQLNDRMMDQMVNRLLMSNVDINSLTIKWMIKWWIKCPIEWLMSNVESLL